MTARTMQIAPHEVHRKDDPCVYFAFDEDNEVLYIGSAKDVMARLREHQRTEWWGRVSYIEVVFHPYRRGAYLAETEAIRAYLPPYNARWVIGTGGTKVRQSAPRGGWPAAHRSREVSE